MSMAPRIAKSKFLIILGFLIFLSISFFVLTRNQDIKDQELIRISNRFELQNRELQDVMEKKMTADRALNHERAINKELNQKVQEQKEIHNKAIMDANLRFESLKQQYKLLKSQYEDLQESSTKEKQQQAEEIDGLKHKVQLLQSQLNKTKRGADSELELLKIKYDTLEKEKANLELKLQEKTNVEKTNDNHGPVPGEGVLAKPSEIKSFNEQQSMIPKQIVDNNNVLQQPSILGKLSSTTTTTTTPSSKISSRNENPAPLVPAITLGDKPINKSPTKENSGRVKVPQGVVWPIPETNQLDDKEDLENEENLAKEAQDQKMDSKDQEKKFDDTLKSPQNANDLNELLENGAHEINDNNDFNIDKDHEHMHQDHDHDMLDSDKNLNNNAAEIDTYDNLGHKNNNNKKNEKLLNEIQGDHGKEGGYPDEMEDLHLDGNAEHEAEEDNGDVGEYDDPKALRQGIAVRN